MGTRKLGPGLSAVWSQRNLDDVPSALTAMDQRPWHAASPQLTMSPQETEETQP
jgi:hypothetical protein